MIENRGKSNAKYPWHELKKEGDFFDWEVLEYENLVKVQNSIRASSKNQEKKVSVRTLSETFLRVYFLGNK